MNKNKKRLTRAVILGLALSSVMAGSAWAETLNLDDIGEKNSPIQIHPNDDIVIEWTTTAKASTSPIFNSNSPKNIEVKANTLTLKNSYSGAAASTLGKGIYAQSADVTITANEIDFKTYDDSVYTSATTPSTTTLNTNKLSLESAQGSGIINNGNNEVHVNGIGSNSSININAGNDIGYFNSFGDYKRVSRQIAVSNQSTGKQVDIKADTIYLESDGNNESDQLAYGFIPYYGINSVIYSGNYTTAQVADSADNITNIIATKQLDVIARKDNGSAINITAGTVNINEEGSNVTSNIKGNTRANGSTSVLNAFYGDNSTINGNISAQSSGTINEHITGKNGVVTGNFETIDNGVIKADFSGEQANLTGNIISKNTTESIFSYDDYAYHDVEYVGGKITVTFSGANSSMTGDITAETTDSQQGEVEATFSGANSSLTGNLVGNGGNITAKFTGSGSTFTGDATNGTDDITGGNIAITLDNASTWSGMSTLNSGTTDVDINNSSTWNMTKTSTVSTLANNGTVDMTADGGIGSNLNIGTLSGNGSFIMDLKYIDNNVDSYISSTESDFISVTGDSSGSHKIYFDGTDSNLGAMSTDDKLYFAQVQGSAAFTDGKTITEVNAKKLYDTDFAIESEANDNSGKDWYITTKERPEDPETPDNPITPPKPNENITSEEGKMRATYALGVEMDRLNKRLGESRYLNEEEDHGLWVRYRYSRDAWENNYRTTGNMFQLGYDKVRNEKDGKHIRGGAIDYTDANTTLKDVSGHGDHERYSMSLYDTWTGDKGHYYDLVLRGGRIHSEYDVNMRGGRQIKSNYHRNFGNISGEYGRKLDGKKGWYVEPQAQLLVGFVGSGRYTTNYGVKVEQDSATSVQGRLGFRLGREMNNVEGNKHSNYYFKADVLHDFAGDQEYKLRSADGSQSYQRKFDGHDTWYDIGVGADIKLTSNRYFWADVERTFGGDYDTTWQINGGFRWEF